MAEGQKETEAEKESQPVRVEDKDSAGEVGAKKRMMMLAARRMKMMVVKKSLTRMQRVKRVLKAAKLKKKDHYTK